MLTTGFLSRHHQCINNYFYPSVDLIRRWQQLVFLIQIYVFGCFIVVLGFFQFNTYMYGPRQSILMPLDTFKRVQLNISSLFLNQNICCWYSKNCLNDTVLWAPNLCYYLYQNICCEYSKYCLDQTVLLSTQKQMLKIWFFVCLLHGSLPREGFSLLDTRFLLLDTRFLLLDTRFLLLDTRLL